MAFGGLALKNTQVNSGGVARHTSRAARQNAAREAGVDFVNVSPVRGDIDEHQSARWIAPRPNTDAALMMGLAHAMIAAGTHDRQFLRECCVGWDELEAYLTGASDGVRRDAAWARRHLRRRSGGDRGARRRDDGTAHARHRELVDPARRSWRAAVLDGRRARRA